MLRREGLDTTPFISYIDTMSALVLIFVVMTAFIAIAFGLSKKAMLDAQQEVEQLRTRLAQVQDAEQTIYDLQAELELYRERLDAAGYENIQEIPARLEWRDAALTKQVLSNTGWSGHVTELPMYADWQNAQAAAEAQAKLAGASGQQALELQQKADRYDTVLKTAGYADIAEIPPKQEWEQQKIRLKSYQTLLTEAGFEGNIDTLYTFLEQWNQIILEMKRVFKVEASQPEAVLGKLKKLESFQKKIVIPVAQGSIFFGFGDVKIEDAFKKSLDTQIDDARKAIKSGSYDLIQIEGHTDNVPVREDNPQYRDNWELSTARAQAVAQYFIERGIPPEHIAVVGHAQYKPKTAGDSPEDRSQNRRIEIVFLNTSLLSLGVGEE